MSVSVVIRCKDEAAGIGRVLDVLAAQTERPEVVVVDSGSTDGTLDVVRGHAVTLVEIPAASFTYGGALNTGCEHATGETLIALSAHSFPTDDGWVARMVAAMAGERVACASGHTHRPDGSVLDGRIVQDLDHATAHPRWGFSCHAGAFRADLWREHPFRTDLPASEDKEWAWHFQRQGWVAVLASDLVVDHTHGSDPVGGQYRRARNDWTGLGMFRDVPRASVRALAHEWWTGGAVYDRRWRARLSHRRMARLLGGYAGRRSASRRS